MIYVVGFRSVFLVSHESHSSAHVIWDPSQKFIDMPRIEHFFKSFAFENPILESHVVLKVESRPVARSLFLVPFFAHPVVHAVQMYEKQFVVYGRAWHPSGKSVKTDIPFQRHLGYDAFVVSSVKSVVF